MSRRILFIVFNFSVFVNVIACSENSASTIANSPMENDSTIITEKLDTIPKINYKEILFDQLVHRMDSLGCKPDTTYFDETMYLENGIHYANYETYFIHELLMDEKNYGDIISVKFNKEYDERFARVKDIKLYPWRMPNTSDGKRVNGVVERWTFGNTTDAEYVFEFLDDELKHLKFPFMKTRPIYFQYGKWVYMFHSSEDNLEVSLNNAFFYEWVKMECYAK